MSQIRVFQPGNFPLHEKHSNGIGVFQGVDASLSRSFGAGYVVFDDVSFDWSTWYDEVICCLEGRFSISAEGETFWVEEKEFIWIPKNTRLTYNAEGKCTAFFALYPVNYKDFKPQSATQTDGTQSRQTSRMIEPIIAQVPNSPSISSNGSPMGVQLHRLFTQARNGAPATMGVVWFEPGQSSKTWMFGHDSKPDAEITYPDGTFELMYVVAGSIDVLWPDGRRRAEAGSAVYFPTGNRYQLVNAGNSIAHCLYVIHPSPN